MPFKIDLIALIPSVPLKEGIELNLDIMIFSEWGVYGMLKPRMVCLDTILKRVRYECWPFQSQRRKYSS